jgi:hypothetical protein
VLPLQPVVLLGKIKDRFFNPSLIFYKKKTLSGIVASSVGKVKMENYK